MMPLDRVDPQGIHPIHGDQREDIELNPEEAVGPRRCLLVPGYVSLAATYKQTLAGSIQRKRGIHWTAEHSAAVVSCRAVSGHKTVCILRGWLTLICASFA